MTDPVKSAVWDGMDEYQQKAAFSAIYPAAHAIVYPALGLCGEAGEVAEKIKKVLRDKGGVIDMEEREALAKELGDVLWYLAALARDLNLSLGGVAQANLNKLADRKNRGTLKGSGDDR